MISAQGKNAPTASASLPIGKYRLDMPIEGLMGLTEFSRFEYATFGREFDGEKDYNAPSLEFLRRRWKVALGTVKGRVFKIALYFDTDSKETAVDASSDVMQLCQQRLVRLQNNTMPSSYGLCLTEMWSCNSAKRWAHTN